MKGMTNASRRTRKPAGAPAGGEFAPETRAEASLPQDGTPQDAPTRAGIPVHRARGFR